MKLKICKFVLVNSLISFLFLSSCSDGFKGADARKIPANMAERQRQNIEEGRGFRLGSLSGNRAGEFDFASSNELWRASLDTIDFMPLASANYSGGIIITDWYNDENNTNESIKITIRFLTNEIRSDALDVKIFKKNCGSNQSCKMFLQKGDLVKEIKKSILKKATLYKKQNKKSYVLPREGGSKSKNSIF